jgi:hypothetical protein
MSATELRDELYRLVKSEAESGKPLRPTSVIEHARLKGVVDEFAVRDALWQLLEAHMVELTADRTLRPRKAERAR